MEELQELVDVAKNSMEEIDLTDGYIKALGCVWNIFGRCLDSKGLEYSPDAGRRFLLEEYGIGSGDSRRLSGVDKRRRRAMAVLENCYNHEPYRHVEDRRHETFFAACHETVFTDFLDGAAKTLADSTLCGYTYTLNRLSPSSSRAGWPTYTISIQSWLFGSWRKPRRLESTSRLCMPPRAVSADSANGSAPKATSTQ